MGIQKSPKTTLHFFNSQTTNVMMKGAIILLFVALVAVCSIQAASVHEEMAVVKRGDLGLRDSCTNSNQCGQYCNCKWGMCRRKPNIGIGGCTWPAPYGK